MRLKFWQGSETNNAPGVYINFEEKTGPWGGGNQFLKALKKEWVNQGLYATKASRAKFILFNSHHNLDRLQKLKSRFPNKILAHRIDGPIELIRGGDRQTDQQIFEVNEAVADISIFQSQWSLNETRKLGWNPTNPAVIMNASDPRIFNREGRTTFSTTRKVKLVSSSWSTNPRKGGATYKWLDQNLDWDSYEYTFVGRSSEEFEHIRIIPPMASKELAGVLKRHDIYITASQRDPCSNAHIEALSCGLPSIFLNDGGHPEIARLGGLHFDQADQVPELIEEVVKNYQKFQDAIEVEPMSSVAQSYYALMLNCLNSRRDK